MRVRCHRTRSLVAGRDRGCEPRHPAVTPADVGVAQSRAAPCGSAGCCAAGPAAPRRGRCSLPRRASASSMRPRSSDAICSSTLAPARVTDAAMRGVRGRRKAAAVTCSASDSSATRSIRLASSRTLPGHGYASERRFRVGRRVFERQAVLAACAIQVVPGEQQDVRSALAKRRQLYGHDGEAMIEVLTESSRRGWPRPDPRSWPQEPRHRQVRRVCFRAASPIDPRAP